MTTEKKPELGNLNVLVVDDSEQAVTVMEKILRQLGIEKIVSAPDGKAALDYLTGVDNSVNVVMCDWQMPNMNGLELLKEIRRVLPDIHFIMVTGKRDIEAVHLAVNSNVDSFLCKPFTPQQLLAKLENIESRS